MKSRYIFTKDADISPMGYGQEAPNNLKKHFKKGDVVWGEVYKNSVYLSDPTVQGYALHIPLDGSNDISDGWDVPLPPLIDSPVEPHPILTITNVAILAVIGFACIVGYSYIQVRRGN